MARPYNLSIILRTKSWASAGEPLARPYSYSMILEIALKQRAFSFLSWNPICIHIFLGVLGGKARAYAATATTPSNQFDIDQAAGIVAAGIQRDTQQGIRRDQGKDQV